MVKDFESFNHLAKDREFPVELGKRGEAHVELASVGVFGGIDVVGEAGHGNGGLIVVEFDFRRDRVAGSSGAGAVGLAMPACRIAGLHKRTREHPVEAHAVVKFFPDEFLEVGDGQGCGFVVEPDHDALEFLFLADPDVQDGDVRTDRGGNAGEKTRDNSDEDGNVYFHSDRAFFEFPDHRACRVGGKEVPGINELTVEIPERERLRQLKIAGGAGECAGNPSGIVF